ncbi:MAG: response regulator [Gammaproteobacteria bacterium]|nr:response regulator [Gammaproteobacteria bacterium]
MTRVLVIDDEPDVRDSIGKMLLKAGYEVRVVGTAAAGLESYQKEVTDLVITDVIMPEQNGVDLIKALRIVGGAAPIIAISGGGNFSSAGYAPGAITTTAFLAAAQKVGADAVLTKPFERKELLDLVSDLLLKAGSSRP